MSLKNNSQTNTSVKSKPATKRMTSIARRINLSFWGKRFRGVIFFDIVLVVLIFATWIYWRNDTIRNTYDISIKKCYFTGNETYESIRYIVEGDNGEAYTYAVHEVTDYLIVPAIVLGLFELIYLFGAFFETGGIRRKLRPLNELAIKAEEISRISLNPDKMKNLEQAINDVSVNSPIASVHTGDKDLQSIEVALNNLLKNMKESEMRQTRFVSDASHELRTPIAVIQGYVNMLDRWGKEDAEVLKESIEALKNESGHMKELVEQLLFLARGDSGRNHLNIVEMSLSQVMQEVWEESMMIDEKHKYTFDGDVDCKMKGDVAMIKQSMRIFVQNASKYSKEGDTIQCRVKRENGFVSYIIQDEGIGMTERDVAHIFERFYRSDDTRNSSTGGSGLGLSIAKWIVDAHGGVIEVISRPEIGTRFIVKFKEV